jgi:hypothetical protein
MLIVVTDFTERLHFEIEALLSLRIFEELKDGTILLRECLVRLVVEDAFLEEILFEDVDGAQIDAEDFATDCIPHGNECFAFFLISYCALHEYS